MAITSYVLPRAISPSTSPSHRSIVKGAPSLSSPTNNSGKDVALGLHRNISSADGLTLTATTISSSMSFSSRSRSMSEFRCSPIVPLRRSVYFTLPLPDYGRLLLKGFLYLRIGELWIFGEVALYEEMMVHTSHTNRRTTYIDVTRMKTLRCVNFLRYFDHYVFEVVSQPELIDVPKTRRAPVIEKKDAEGGKTLESALPLRKADRYTFKARDSTSMLTWLEHITDANSGDFVFAEKDSTTQLEWDEAAAVLPLRGGTNHS